MCCLPSNPDSSLEAARPVLPAADMPPHWLWAAMCQKATWAREEVQVEIAEQINLSSIKVG